MAVPHAPITRRATGTTSSSCGNVRAHRRLLAVQPEITMTIAPRPSAASQCCMPAFEAVAATAPVASPRSKANHAGGVQPNIDMIPAIAITATDGDPANAVASMMATMNAPNPAAQIDSHAAVAPENATVTPSPMDAASGSGATTKSSAPVQKRGSASAVPLACAPRGPRRQTTVMTTRPAVLRKDTKPHQNVGTSSQRRHRSGGAQNDSAARKISRPSDRDPGDVKHAGAQHESDSICIPGFRF